jgi:plastocyanin
MASHPTHRLFARAAGATAVLIVALGTVLGPGAAPASAASHAIVIKQYAYSPPALTIAQGDTVTWTNRDSVAHDVTVSSGPAHFHSPLLAQGRSWSFTFSTAGSYSYLCSVHPDMVAAITVTPKATPTKAANQQPTRPPSQAPSQAPTRAPAVTTPVTTAPAHAAHPATATTPHGRIAAPAAAADLPAVSAPATSSATLDPLLIVAGASTAVMVFCLLLLSSRPAKQPADGSDTETTANLATADESG